MAVCVSIVRHIPPDVMPRMAFATLSVGSRGPDSTVSGGFVICSYHAVTGATGSYE